MLSHLLVHFKTNLSEIKIRYMTVFLSHKHKNKCDGDAAH